MKFLRNVLLLTTFAVTLATAQNSPTMADAQKAYVAGNWKVAADAYEKLCPSQPADAQVSCNLWGILAMSQVGDAKSFKKAGIKLDSLIESTNPQHANYADLVMTRAQFMLYLGKYDKASEDLIHAIETSQSNHNLVLQKVCSAILSRTNSQDLQERCDGLKSAAIQKPETPTEKPTVTPAPAETKPTPQQTAQKPAQDSIPAKVPAEKATTDSVVASAPAQPATAVQPAAPAPETKTETPKKEENKSEQASVEKKKEPSAVTPTQPSEEYWVLQLGAFGMKNNATLLVSNLKKQKIQSTIVELPRGDRILYLVQTGHFKTKDAAIAYGEKTLAPLKVEYQALLKK